MLDRFRVAEDSSKDGALDRLSRSDASAGRMKTMQRDKYAKTELRPNRATGINITAERTHPNYQLKVQPSSLATDTGHLELFRLEPLKTELPTFSARWDLKPNTIDIDLIGDPEASKAFKAATGEYKGHHTVIVSDSPRIYQVDIQTPAGIVFVGKIEVAIELGLYLRDRFEALRDEIKDELRILAKCRCCGLVEISGPPFVLDRCPKCRCALRSEPD